LFLWGALSDERTGLQFAAQSLNGPSRTQSHTLLSHQTPPPNLEGQVPVFMIFALQFGENYISIHTFNLFNLERFTLCLQKMGFSQIVIFILQCVNLY
jgi:hypothetical protein